MREIITTSLRKVFFLTGRGSRFSGHHKPAYPSIYMLLQNRPFGVVNPEKE